MATGVTDLGGIIKGYKKNRGRQAEMWGEGDEDDGASNLKQPKLEREGVRECQNEQFYLYLECQETKTFQRTLSSRQEFDFMDVSKCRTKPLPQARELQLDNGCTLSLGEGPAFLSL